MRRGYRQERIGVEIKKIISDMLLREIKDPRLADGMVSITDVEVTRDGSYAKVFLTVYANEEDTEAKARALEGLEHCKGLIKRDTIWMTAAEKLGIANPDSMKYVPVGRPADGSFFVVHSTFDPSLYDTIYQGVIELRKKAQFNMKSNEFDMLVEFRARLEDYMDGMNEKKVKSVKADLTKRHRNRAELMLDNEDQTDGEWYGLRIGDLEDTNNKMAGNWE